MCAHAIRVTQIAKCRKLKRLLFYGGDRKPVSVHPIVAESVGKDMIEQMKVAQSEEGKANVA